MSACNCIGPQRGEPLCPCMMRGVIQRDGHWVRETDLGPVQKPFTITPPTVVTQGCVCPVGAEISCQGTFCPRRGAGGILATSQHQGGGNG